MHFIVESLLNNDNNRHNVVVLRDNSDLKNMKWIYSA